MIAADIITPVRKILGDETATYRWANSTLWDQWGNETLNLIWERRPDSRFSTSTGAYTAAVTLPTSTGETLPTATLSIDATWKQAMIDGILYRAFSQDADDLQNLQRAAGHKALFDAALAGR